MSVSADTFTFVADLVRRRTAIELMAGRESHVESRLQPLVRQSGLGGLDEYVNRLRATPWCVEHDRVVEALTTNETAWFRDVASYRALTGHVIPALIDDRLRDRRERTTLRIWSAACSTGQEPYSIAMALLDAAPGVPVRITATDVSQEVLRRGVAGRYSQLEINRGLPAAMLVRHFARSGTEWQLSARVRSMVTFSRHNLLDAVPSGGPFDIVFLRNVLIYFDLETRKKVLHAMCSALRPRGFLLMGAVESAFSIDHAWEPVEMGRGSVFRLRELVNARGAV